MAAAGCPSFGGPVPVGLQRTYWGPAVQELGPHSRLQGHQAALARWHPLALPVTGGRGPLGQIIWDPLTPEMERKRVTYLLTPDTRGAFRLIEPPSLPPQPQTTGRPQTHHHHRHRRRAITVLSTFTRLVVFSSSARRSAARCLCFCRPPIGENF